MKMLSTKWMLVVAVAMAGCAVQATYHSKNGRAYAQITPRAVILDDAEAKIVMASGGQVIGTIEGRGLTVTSSVADVNDRAAQVAAEEGGTHVIVAHAEMVEYAWENPGVYDRRCRRTDDGRECTSTFVPASTTTYEKPSGDYIVVRVPPQQWGMLPPELQPMP
ncbi:MAG TPA: hypothetical protein VGM90_40240 [Kofleriaceae bacterium]|jgi:hypothetical protein